MKTDDDLATGMYHYLLLSIITHEVLYLIVSTLLSCLNTVQFVLYHEVAIKYSTSVAKHFRYDDVKVGIFIHWGVFSVPSYGEGFAGEWFWWSWKGLGSPSAVYFMEQNYRPDFQYADFASDFTAELFDPYKWANLFKVRYKTSQKGQISIILAVLRRSVLRVAGPISAPGQRSSEETSQWWRIVATVSHLTRPGIEPL